MDLPQIKSANKKLQVPIYSLAFGAGADFNLLKDISDQNHGFAQRIYEYGNSFEQIEAFFNGISDPKLRNVKFEYLYNGHKIPASSLTTTRFDQVSGNNDYWICGVGYFDRALVYRPPIRPTKPIRPTYPLALPPPKPIDLPIDTDENEPQITVIMEANEGEFRQEFTFEPHHKLTWNKSEKEAFMERLWAFKRIKYLLEDKDCEKALWQPKTKA